MASSGDDKRPSQVLDHLFIGSRSHAKNRGLLKELGINRILNVTPQKTMDPTNGVPNFFEKDRSMTYKRVAVFDNRGEDLLQHLNSCIAFIEQGSFYGKVLVHCNKGVSRSSTVVAAYLMSTRGLSKDEAMKYLRSRRSIVCPHEGFMSQLEAFDGKLKRERDAAIAEGRPKKYPDDLLQAGSRGGHQGPSIGPSRGPSVAVPGPNKRVRNRSPPRAREMPSIGPSRGPSVAVPGPEKCVRDRSPPRLGKTPQGASIGPSIGPSRGPSITVPGPKKCARSTSPLREETTPGREIGPSPPRHHVTMIGPPRGPSPSVSSVLPEDTGSREFPSSKDARTGGAARESSNPSGVLPMSEPASGGDIKPALIGPPARPRIGQREHKAPNMGKVSEEDVGIIESVLERPRDVNDVQCNAVGFVLVENGDCGAAVGGNKRKREGEDEGVVGDKTVGPAHKARIDERCTAVSGGAEG